MDIIISVYYTSIKDIGIYKWRSSWEAWEFACSLAYKRYPVAIAPADPDRPIDYLQFPSGKH